MKTLSVFCDETANFRTPSDPKRGEAVELRLRVGRGQADVVSVFVMDGKSQGRRDMRILSEEGEYTIFCVSLPGAEDRVCYDFELLHQGEWYYFGRNGLKKSWTDLVFFEILPELCVPAWAKGAVYYQIYTDRFCNGDAGNDVENGEYTDDLKLSSVKAAWDSPVAATDVNRFYGGDLEGIRQKIGYLKALGIQVIYLNPIFVSPSNHKYNIQDYEHVDPHLGVIVNDAQGKDRYRVRTTDEENLLASDEKLAELIRECHENGIRVVLDGVFNHCGAFHRWMDIQGLYTEEGRAKGAYLDPDSPYRGYFSFTGPKKYECWWNNKTLPKLNLDGSQELRQEILRIARKWVSPPFNADGWRLDVAADACHTPEANHIFWKEFRSAVREANPDAVVFAEHYGNPESWLRGGEWDSIMNYDAFLDPVSWFFTGLEKHSDRKDDKAKGDSSLFFRTMQENMSRLPGPALESSLCQLDNHDHSRFLTRTNGTVGRLKELGTAAAEKNVRKDRLRQAVLLQMTWPGAPGIYYGDEVGVCGFTDPDDRRPYPWGKEDLELLDFFQQAVRMRKSFPALQRGSLLPLYEGQNVLAYGRFLGTERLITAVSLSETTERVLLTLSELAGDRPEAVQRIFATERNNFNVGQLILPSPEGILELELSPDSALVLTWDTEVRLLPEKRQTDF